MRAAQIAKVARILATIAAVVAAFISVPYIAVVFAVLGLIVGFAGVEEERRLLFFVMAVTLTTVAGALGGVPVLGEYLRLLPMVAFSRSQGVAGPAPLLGAQTDAVLGEIGYDSDRIAALRETGVIGGEAPPAEDG